MGKRIKKLKKIRIHREGTDTLVFSAVAIVAIALLLWYAVPTKVPFWGFVAALCSTSTGVPNVSSIWKIPTR